MSNASKHLRIASILVILLGVISILALRGILGSDTAFSGLSEAEGKSALFGLTALYVLNGFKILAGLLGLLLAGKKSLLTVILGVILFVAQLWNFFQAGSEMVEIIINIVLLVIPYYYLHNAYKLFKSGK